MARLYRPHIPLKVRCQVAARQIKWHDPDMLLRLHRKNLSHLLSQLMGDLAKGFGCEVKDLRLDHEPALALREQYPDGAKTIYAPAANSVEHLIYRPHGAQFDGSHDVKTRIRGEHGQFSDVALIKRERRRERRANPSPYLKKKGDLREKRRKAAKEIRRKLRRPGKKPKTRWQSRPFRSKKSPHRFGERT